MNLILNKFQIANGVCVYNQETQRKIHKHIYKMLNKIEKETGEKYYLISTTTEVTQVDGDAIIIQIDAKSYSYNGLKDIIEKSAMYDDLCS